MPMDVTAFSFRTVITGAGSPKLCASSVKSPCAIFGAKNQSSRSKATFFKKHQTWNSNSAGNLRLAIYLRIFFWSNWKKTYLKNSCHILHVEVRIHYLAFVFWSLITEPWEVKNRWKPTGWWLNGSSLVMCFSSLVEGIKGEFSLAAWWQRHDLPL